MPKEGKVGFLPRIDPGFPDNKMCNRRTDKTDRPVTLELIHGREKQVRRNDKKIIEICHDMFSGNITAH